MIPQTITQNKNSTLLSLIGLVSKRNVTDNDKIAFIKVLLLKICLMDVMYDIRDTNIYQKGIKMTGNAFLNELKKNLFEDEYTNLVGSDAVAVEELEKNIELLANEIVGADLGVFAVMIECLKRYKENPDFIKKQLNIIVGDSEGIRELEQRELLIQDVISLPFKAHAQIKPLVDSLKNIYSCST